MFSGRDLVEEVMAVVLNLFILEKEASFWISFFFLFFFLGFRWLK